MMLLLLKFRIYEKDKFGHTDNTFIAKLKVVVQLHGAD